MEKSDINKIEDRVRKYQSEHLSTRRLKHIEGVIDTAVLLADRYGADRNKAALAALCHDMFKERDLDDLVREYGLSDKYLGSNNLAHGKIAAEYMKRELGITDDDILNAVSYHTTGRAGMSLLEKIIFMADTIEPQRDYPGVEEVRELTFKDLDAACALSCERTLEIVEKKGFPVDSDTKEAKGYFDKLISERSANGGKMDSREMAVMAAETLDIKKGDDVVIIDVAEKSGFTDYLVVATGGSERQTIALSEAVEDKFEEYGIVPRGTEGKNGSGWILSDYGDIVVNVFTEAMRNKYNIEKIWADCETVGFNKIED